MATTLPRPAHPTECVEFQPSQLSGPPLIRWLCNDARAGWLWLPLRLYLG